MSVPVRCLTCLIFSWFGQLALAVDVPGDGQLWTGKLFRQNLDHPVNVVFTRSDLLFILHDLAANQQIALVLDRRQDSSVVLTIDSRNDSLLNTLTKITRMVNCELVVIDNVVYCGPISATSRLRTLVELRKSELPLKTTGIPNRRRLELLTRQTFKWTDLQSAREIIEAIAAKCQMKVTNLDLIPHDLWAAKTLPETSVVEALSIVLNQFDLTFAWRQTGSSIELVPIPDQIRVERRIHPVQKLSDALELVRQRYPTLEVTTLNTDLVVKGLVEECELAEELLRGKKTNKNKTEDPQDLRSQQFTFSVPVAVPLSLILKKLEESNITFEYDPEEMKDHGVDLEQLIEINVTKVSTEKFFKALFDPAKIDFQIQQSTVKLTPKKRK